MRTASALAATAAGVGLLVAIAPIAAADEPDEYGSAYVTIANLEAAGFTVHIDRVGSAPLEECIVTDVRNPQEVTRWVRVDDHGGWDDDHHGGWDGDNNDNNSLNFHRGGDEWVEVVVSKTITVSLNCTS